MNLFKKSKVFLILMAMVPLFASPAVGTQDSPLAPFKALEGKIDIAGGTAHIPVMKDAAEAIMKANPKIRITVAGGGSGVGVQKVGEGLGVVMASAAAPFLAGCPISKAPPSS